jgi:hypothetical protein
MNITSTDATTQVVGTSFSVAVDTTTQVDVDAGTVRVTDSSGALRLVQAGESVVTDHNGFVAPAASPVAAVVAVSNTLSITTADGAGGDARVVGKGLGRELINTGGEADLQVRRIAWTGGRYADYLRFDLTALAARPLLTAHLRLTMLRATTVPFTLRIHALRGDYAGGADGSGAPEVGSDWQEGSARWYPLPGVICGDNAPGFDEKSGSVNERIAPLLGTVQVSAATAAGTVLDFAEPSLRDAIAAARAGHITLILATDRTDEQAILSLASGEANSGRPTLLLDLQP